MGKSASQRGRPLVVNRDDFIQALTLRVSRIQQLITTYSKDDELNPAGLLLLTRCYAAAKDDLSKASKGG